ncbi:MAG: hypothetical protein LC733_06445, partial [Actinobacteria bacterium]|nr:hypothetical protein [Actinomycetota bacterium]
MREELVAARLSSVVLSSTWSGRTGTAIIKVGRPEGPAAMVVKLTGAANRRELFRSAQMLAALRSEAGLDGLCDLLPRPIGVGEIHGKSFSVETALPGTAPSFRLDP